MTHIAKILLIIGGLNWGLIGIGEYFGKDLNFINLLAQFSPSLPMIIYIVVGLAAIILMFKRG